MAGGASPGVTRLKQMVSAEEWRNHRALALGSSPSAMRALEKVCTVQIKALSAGRLGVSFVPEAVLNANRPVGAHFRATEMASLAWASLLRQLDDESPGYGA